MLLLQYSVNPSVLIGGLEDSKFAFIAGLGNFQKSLGVPLLK